MGLQFTAVVFNPAVIVTFSLLKEHWSCSECVSERAPMKKKITQGLLKVLLFFSLFIFLDVKWQYVFFTTMCRNWALHPNITDRLTRCCYSHQLVVVSLDWRVVSIMSFARVILCYQNSVTMCLPSAQADVLSCYHLSSSEETEPLELHTLGYLDSDVNHGLLL